MTLKEKLLQKREKAKRLDEAQVSKFLWHEIKEMLEGFDYLQLLNSSEVCVNVLWEDKTSMLMAYFVDNKGTKHDLRHREFVIPNGMNFEHIIEYAMRLAKQDGVEAYKDEVQSIGFWNFAVKW